MVDPDKEIELTFFEWLTKELLLPLFPEGWKDYGDLEGEELDYAQSILAKQYVEHGNLKLARVPLSAALVYDLLFHLPPIVHGMLLSGVGSIYLAVPGIETPESLAGDTIVDTEDERSRLDRRAKRSVDTNVGVITFLGGFLIQIAAVIGIFGNEVLSQNLLKGTIPALYGAAIVAIVWRLWYSRLGTWLRDRFPYWWNV